MSGKRILLVDDDLDDIELTTMHFRHSHIDGDIITRRDGYEALEFLERTAASNPSQLPDLVVADIKMPRMTGLEMTRRMREDGKLRNIPVVFLTSSENENDHRQATRLGALRYIRKPVQYYEFCKVADQIKEVLDGISAKT